MIIMIVGIRKGGVIIVNTKGNSISVNMIMGNNINSKDYIRITITLTSTITI